MTTHRLYCICGAKVEAASEPKEMADRIVEWFTERHTGKDGHALTDAVTARRSRARADRAGATA